MVSWAPRSAPAVSGSGVRCGCVCWARVSTVPSSSWLGCRGVFFFLRFCFFFFFFSVPGFVVPVPPSPFFFFRAGLVALPFSFLVSLFPVGRCPWLGVAGIGWVVPLCLFGGPVFGALWGGVWPPLVVLAGGLAAVGCFRAFSPSPLLFFFLRGGGLPVPPSAFPGLAHAVACIQCCLPGCCFQLRSVWPRSGPMGRVGYVHGGLGAPSCRVRSWLCRLGGCARRLLVVLGYGAGVVRVLSPLRPPAVFFWVVRHCCRQACCGPVCGLRCWCVACWRGAFQGVRWLASVSPSG